MVDQQSFEAFVAHGREHGLIRNDDVTVVMLDMQMGSFTLPLRERSAGTYGRMFPVVGMSGRWGCRVEVAPRGGRAFQVTLVDRMLG